MLATPLPKYRSFVPQLCASMDYESAEVMHDAPSNTSSASHVRRMTGGEHVLSACSETVVEGRAPAASPRLGESVELISLECIGEVSRSIPAKGQGDYEELVAFEDVKRKSGLGFSKSRVGAMLLANTLLGGSGMLGIPYALSVSGYALGLLFLVFFGGASAFGCHLLHCSARKIGRAPCSFFTVANAVAPRWTWLIDGAVAVKCFGVGTSYLIIVGDLVPDAMTFFGIGDSTELRWFWISVSFSVAAPLACLRNLSSLRFTATGAVCIVAWTVTLIMLFFARAGGTFDPCAFDETLGVDGRQANFTLVGGSSARVVQPPYSLQDDELPCRGASFEAFTSDPVALFKVLPVFIFGFTCQQNIFTICNEVRNASKRRVDNILAMSYTLAGCAFAIAALMGYATYGNRVHPDVLKGYPQSKVVEFTRILYSVLATVSYPLQMHPSRTSVLALFRLCCPLRGSVEEGAEEWRYVIVTLVLLLCSYALALTVTNLGVVLAIVGASGSTMVSYILPGLVYFRTFKEPHFKRHMAIVQFCFGCVIMPTCLIMIFV